MLRRIVSGLVLTMLLVGMLTFTFNVQLLEASGAIYIRPDGSIEGTDKIQRDGDFYIFTDNINDSIVVERSNIIVDGRGFTLQGTGAYGTTGISFSGLRNLTIRNINIKDFYTGIFVGAGKVPPEVTFNNIISGNNISNSGNDGIILWYSLNNIISGNIITGSSTRGILLDWSSNNTISRNIISGNGEGIHPFMSSNNSIFHNDFVGNLQHVYSYESNNTWDDGYPSGGNYWSDYKERYPDAEELNDSGIWDTPYVINENNTDRYPLVTPWIFQHGAWTVDDDGPADFSTIQEAINNATDGDTIFVHNGTYYENIVVSKTVSLVGQNKNATVIDANGVDYKDVVFITADNVVIDGFTIQNGGEYGTGIFIDDYTSNVTIRGNHVENNSGGVIVDDWASNNTIMYNVITKNRGSGVGIYGSNNFVYNNTVSYSEKGVGIGLDGSYRDNSPHCNRVIKNTVIGNYYIGIDLFNSSYNEIAANSISDNYMCLWVRMGSGNNVIYHNNFISAETDLAGTYEAGENTWDNGYPSGGNYWSDYNRTDNFWGINQDLKGCDMIGDEPYVIDENNIDRYPLMTPWRQSRPPITEFPDINGDGKIEMKDIAIVAKAFGREFGDP